MLKTKPALSSGSMQETGLVAACGHGGAGIGVGRGEADPTGGSGTAA
ncbi:MAG: hypothetical protein ACKO1N_02045 [Erythrobacter sp.]